MTDNKAQASLAASSTVMIGGAALSTVEGMLYAGWSIALVGLLAIIATFVIRARSQRA